MTRAERVCASLSTWMLRMIVAGPRWRGWWSAAWLELWRREVVEVIEAETIDDSGPWAVDAPKGRN